MSDVAWTVVVLVAWVPLVIAAVQLTTLWRRRREREASWWPQFEREFRAYAERVGPSLSDRRRSP